MEKSKQKTKNKLKVIISLSIILVLIFIILNIKASKEHSWDSLGYVGMEIIDIFILWLIWIIYLIRLAIWKRKNNDKHFWIPSIIAIFMIIAPTILYFIVLSIRTSYIK